jgi:hypothetical protein
VLIFLGIVVIAVVVMVPLSLAFAGAALSSGSPYGSVVMMPLMVVITLVPIIFVYILWSVTIPAYVTERTGMIEAFGRSIELTNGARGKIFLILVVIGIATFVIGYLFGRIGAIGGNGIFLAAMTTLAGVVTGTVMVMIIASVYVELRNVKEGVEPSDLEAIFA